MEKNRINGRKAELKIAKELRKFHNNVKVNHTWGTDVVVKCPEKEYDTLIEVKSAHYEVGIKEKWKGKFYFYPYNLDRPDFFAFIIYYEEGSDTFWVKKKIIVDYFRNHKKKTKLSLGIPTLLEKIDTIDFGEVIKHSL